MTVSRPITGTVVASGARPVELANGFQFTEGPAADAAGNVYFTDLRVSQIHRWSIDGKLILHRENSGGANGLFFDRDGNLLACEGEHARITSIDPQGNVTVLADQYNNRPFNKTNDLWIDPAGGVYFSDPAYGGAQVVQDGEHVYYITPDRNRVSRVIDDMVRPNGLIGTPDGKTLYVADAGARETYRYKVNDDGTLSGKTLFVSFGSDGMTIDTEGNVYLTENGVLAFDPEGKLIEQIDVPNRPTNVCFGGPDRQTLFITARSSIYSIQMQARGVPPWQAAKPGLPDTGQTGDFTQTHGEDSDYWINPPSFTDNGDGTVRDNVTSLTWQQTDGGEMTWADARNYAENLTLAGHDDWRLPTSHELFGVLDHGSTNPAIDTDYFAVTGAEYWWANRGRADDPSRVWSANAGGGIGAHRASETISAGGTRPFHAWCVRGESSSFATDASKRLADNGDGTVTDSGTGLTWQRVEVDTSMTWEDAIVYCETLTLAGHDDWRLPNVKELRSISDDALVQPSLDTRFFPGVDTMPYWTSTTEGFHAPKAWFVDFHHGMVGYDEKSQSLAVRPVRGGVNVKPSGESPSDTGRSVADRPRPEPRDDMRLQSGGRQTAAGSPGRQGSGGGQGGSRNPVILALDANGDGEISAEEVTNGPAALMRLDANGDGRVSREEMRPPDGGQGRQRQGGPSQGGQGGGQDRGRGQGNGPRGPAPAGRRQL